MTAPVDHEASLPFEDLAEAAEQPRGLPAWALSVTLHITLILALGLLSRVPTQQPQSEPDRTSGIALVPRPAAPSSFFFSGS